MRRWLGKLNRSAKVERRGQVNGSQWEEGGVCTKGGQNLVMGVGTIGEGGRWEALDYRSWEEGLVKEKRIKSQDERSHHNW